MDQFIDYSGQGGLEVADDAGDRPAQSSHISQHFTQPAASALQDQPNPSYFAPSVSNQISCDIKPRLTKEQHDILEAHYQKQAKPNTNTKKSFAEHLNVSLDKVNNWFQNRRAKTKQDAKKQASAFNIFPPRPSLSDSETSPSFAAPDYIAMMQQMAADNQASNGLGITQLHHQPHDQMQMHAPPGTAMSQHLQPDMFDSQEELNRRTLTQEQFDAMNQTGDVNVPNSFEPLQLGFHGEPDFMNQIFGHQMFTDLPDNYKPQEVWAGLHPTGAPLSSNDSTIPSSISEQSMLSFTAPNAVQNISGANSEWTESRSTSLSSTQQDGLLAQQQMVPSTSQWQPGQSVPVDFDALNEEFRQAAQARPSTQPPIVGEQPLAWPADEAFVRRGSQTSLLAHSMNNVNIQTPHPPQAGTFKSPAPPSNIAARRQRKPAQLGLASLRSQSYSAAAGQPVSPGRAPHQPTINTAQPLRRIRSSQVIGSVAHGRVMKSLPGSAQRSPLNWNFADALNSPHAVRHASAQAQGNLAPPTPLSPSEFPQSEQSQQIPAWHASSVQPDRQPSIGEAVLEHGDITYQLSATLPPNNFSSPPHTPMYYQSQFVQRIGGNAIMENTPPQSAPASQTCFPAGAFAVPQQPVQQHAPQAQPIVQQHTMLTSQPQHYVNITVPDQQIQMQPTFTYMQVPQPSVAVAPPPNYQFAGAVPIADADGNIQFAYPAQGQFMPPQHPPAPPQQNGTPPQMAYTFATSAGGSPNMQGTAPPPKQNNDFFVHEYSPPDALKRAATPRRAVDTGPKNYTFANAGPEHFEDKKAKKESSISSGSPASSTGAASAP